MTTEELAKSISELRDPFSNREVRDKIIALVIKEVKDNGSCRAGWAAEHIIRKPQQNHVHDKIAGLVTKSNKYLKERNAKFPEDWNIIENPTYKEMGFWSKNPFYEKLAIALISGGISLAVGLTISKQSKQSQNLKDKQQDSLIQDVSDSLSSLGNQLDTLQ